MCTHYIPPTGTPNTLSAQVYRRLRANGHSVEVASREADQVYRDVELERARHRRDTPSNRDDFYQEAV